MSESGWKLAEFERDSFLGLVDRWSFGFDAMSDYFNRWGMGDETHECPRGQEWTGAICVLRNFDAVNRNCPTGQHWVEPPQSSSTGEAQIMLHQRYGCVPDVDFTLPVWTQPTTGPSTGWIVALIIGALFLFGKR